MTPCRDTTVRAQNQRWRPKMRNDLGASMERKREKGQNGSADSAPFTRLSRALTDFPRRKATEVAHPRGKIKRSHQVGQEGK